MEVSCGESARQGSTTYLVIISVSQIEIGSDAVFLQEHCGKHVGYRCGIEARREYKLLGISHFCLDLAYLATRGSFMCGIFCLIASTCYIKGSGWWSLEDSDCIAGWGGLHVLRPGCLSELGFSFFPLVRPTQRAERPMNAQ
jgi:hypothetical protein